MFKRNEIVECLHDSASGDFTQSRIYVIELDQLPISQHVKVCKDNTGKPSFWLAEKFRRLEVGDELTFVDVQETWGITVKSRLGWYVVKKLTTQPGRDPVGTTKICDIMDVIGINVIVKSGANNFQSIGRMTITIPHGIPAVQMLLNGKLIGGEGYGGLTNETKHSRACECGNKTNPVGQGHSDWCKMYKREFL